MRVLLLILVLFGLAGVLAWLIFMPKNRLIVVQRAGGGTVSFSRTGMRLDPPEDFYATNGYDRIQSYVAKLQKPSSKYRSVSFFSPDGKRGFGLDAQGTNFFASFNIDVSTESDRELLIRLFF